jgi:hypothetical protein
MKKSKILMIIGSLLLLALFVFPLWNITLEAPQYPIPLGMEIHINKFSDTHEFDIKNINLMNHYVGMKYIPDTIPEFKIFPWVIAIMIAFGVLFGFLGKYKLFLVWFILMCVLGTIGMYDFYLWEYDYGHNLDPKAITFLSQIRSLFYVCRDVNDPGCFFCWKKRNKFLINLQSEPVRHQLYYLI